MRHLNDATDIDAATDAIFEFCTRVLKIVAPLVPAVKFNSGFFEKYYWDGVENYYSLIQEATELGLEVIGDVKRGDIGSTAEAYAEAHLKNPEFLDMDGINAPDAITINGFDALSAPVSRTMSFSYNATSQVTQVDGPRSDISDISTVAYYSCTRGGQCGQTQSTSNAKGHTISYDQYDANGRLLQQTDAKGTVSTFVYHPRGWLLS